MPTNNPVQVVLNSERFLEGVPTSKHPISHKDFYEDDNDGFIEHKHNIVEILSDIQRNLEQSDLPICYAKINMRDDAIAKSYKPTSIFAPSRDDSEIPFVGGGSVGEIYIELTPNRVARSTNIIQSEAEDQVIKFNARTRKLEASAIRSELGAIDNISEYTPDDKKSFTTNQAISYLQDIHSATYIVKLFRQFPSNARLNAMSESMQDLFISFRDGITQIADGVIIKNVLNSNSKVGTIEITVTVPSTSDQSSYNYDFDIHDRILNFLLYHPLVRKISLPAKIQLVRSDFTENGNFAIPPRNSESAYPMLGIIDGGISDVLNNWIAYKYDPTKIQSEDDLKHGTFIAGLASFGQSLNDTRNCPEYDGCLLADVNIFTSGNMHITSDVLDELELAIINTKLKTNSKARIFNLSINIPDSDANNYDDFTQRLDKIAEEQNVIIVVSAGNIRQLPFRTEWCSNIPTNINNLDSYAGNDCIENPAMSIRNISIGAVNPIDDSCISSISLAPTNYTKRGLSSKIILKPDLAYVGGRGFADNHGLSSLSTSGSVISSAGTSYAAPLVARILASLDNEIVSGEPIARETLIALLIHSARIPDCLSDNAYKTICRDFVGFGIPDSSREILNNDDHEIRLVFNSVLLEKKRMVFDFNYPASLVNESGGITGEMQLTLVSTPPIDDRFDVERVRINVKAQVSQYDPVKTEKVQAARIIAGKPATDKLEYNGLLKSVFANDSDADRREKNLINVGLKWGTTKKYKFRSPEGTGKSSALRLVIDYESRENTPFPREGIPFSAILTIKDPNGERPIFHEMQNQLQNDGITITNIQTASQIMV